MTLDPLGSSSRPVTMAKKTRTLRRAWRAPPPRCSATAKSSKSRGTSKRQAKFRLWCRPNLQLSSSLAASARPQLVISQSSALELQLLRALLNMPQSSLPHRKLQSKRKLKFQCLLSLPLAHSVERLLLLSSLPLLPQLVASLAVQQLLQNLCSSPSLEVASAESS